MASVSLGSIIDDVAKVTFVYDELDETCLSKKPRFVAQRGGRESIRKLDIQPLINNWWENPPCAEEDDGPMWLVVDVEILPQDSPRLAVKSP